MEECGTPIANLQIAGVIALFIFAGILVGGFIEHYFFDNQAVCYFNGQPLEMESYDECEKLCASIGQEAVFTETGVGKDGRAGQFCKGELE